MTDEELIAGKYKLISPIKNWKGRGQSMELRGKLSNGTVRRHGWTGEGVNVNNKEFMDMCCETMDRIMNIYEQEENPSAHKDIPLSIVEQVRSINDG